MYLSLDRAAMSREQCEDTGPGCNRVYWSMVSLQTYLVKGGPQSEAGK